MTLNRRVVGSTPALAATLGPWASPLPTVACALRLETPIQCSCCSRERLQVVEDLKGRYRNGQNESRYSLHLRHRQFATYQSDANIIICTHVLVHVSVYICICVY